MIVTTSSCMPRSCRSWIRFARPRSSGGSWFFSVVKFAECVSQPPNDSVTQPTPDSTSQSSPFFTLRLNGLGATAVIAASI